MRIIPTPISGAWLIEPERLHDERGFFARTWCQREIEKIGISASFVQCSLSFNAHSGTVRGMHLQARPHEEMKLIRCTAGAVFDVIVDTRPDSPSFRQWYGAELTCENRHQLFVPKGVAHGFQTLLDRTEVFYQMSEFYVPDSQRGFRYDDPAIHIAWPLPTTVISPKDSAMPCLDALEFIHPSLL
jgi:dTDP-4-dehydrorhamnose 3,5-epimerase